MFWGTFFPGLEGFKEIHKPDVDIFRMYMPDIAAFTESGLKPGESVICTGKIKHVGSTYVEQWNYLKSIVPKERVQECKITLAAPEWYHMRYKQGRAYPKDVYASDKEYFADIAKAYQTELQILYDNGLRNVQFDDPNFACKTPSPFRKVMRANRRRRFLLREVARRLEERRPEFKIDRPNPRRVHQLLQ